MVKIRLWRMGSKDKPFYRIVAIDSRKKLNAEYIEQIGTYDPLKKNTKINEEIALKWLNTGAEPSETVKNLLSKDGIIKKFHDQKQKK